MLELIKKRVYKNKRNYLCSLYRCSCGNEKILQDSRVKSGNTKSCGCLRRGKMQLLGRIQGLKFKTHGLTNSPIYVSWSCMKTRCRNPKSGNYAYYGGRGITYCPEWESFENFYSDMFPRPMGKTLDRIDPLGNYCKDNCKWSTYKEQVNNRRRK